MKIINRLFIKLYNQRQYINHLRKRGMEIGNYCIIDKTAFFGSEPWLIKIGNNTRISRNCSFITHDGGLWTLRKINRIPNESVKYGKIRIGNNCNISWNVIIMPNVTIGNNCIVAAGAVVTKNIPDNEIWGGIPAKKIESLDEYYEKVKNTCDPTNNMKEQEKLEYLKENRKDLFI